MIRQRAKQTEEEFNKKHREKIEKEEQRKEDPADMPSEGGLEDRQIRRFIRKHAKEDKRRHGGIVFAGDDGFVESSKSGKFGGKHREKEGEPQSAGSGTVVKKDLRQDKKNKSKRSTGVESESESERGVSSHSVAHKSTGAASGKQSPKERLKHASDEHARTKKTTDTKYKNPALTMEDSPKAHKKAGKDAVNKGGKGAKNHGRGKSYMDGESSEGGICEMDVSADDVSV